MNFNFGKIIVLIFAAVTVFPMALLIIGCMVHINESGHFETSTLGKLTNLFDNDRNEKR